MPYSIQKKGNKFVVKNTETGDVKGTHKTKMGAKKQVRLLYMIKGGKKPTGKKSNLRKKTVHYKTD